MKVPWEGFQKVCEIQMGGGRAICVITHLTASKFLLSMDAIGSNPVNGSIPERRIGPRQLRDHKEELWVAIHGRVYALAEFHDHPGGTEILKHEAGKDASRAFDEIGHSRVAKRLLPKYDIGVFISEDEEDAITRLNGKLATSSSFQVPKPLDKVELNGSAEVGCRSAGSDLIVEPSMTTPNNGADQKESAEDDGTTVKVTKGLGPPVPSFQQKVLLGEISRRPKQPLAPGFSAMAWLRHHQTIAQKPPRKLKMEEISRHNKPDDAWIVLHGVVYDVTPYLQYHPGGVDELLRGAGRDASSLFESVHPWVNVNALIMKCCVGSIDYEV